jgi:sterol desaturase/sphingolipid hydroxylase (fatty acid hydroxylase superfamily)
MDAAAFRLSTFVGGFCLMFCLETIFPSRAWQVKRRIRLLFHAALMLFNAVVLRFPAVFPLIVWLKFVNERQWGLAPMMGLSAAGNILIGIVVLDMFDYWWHRFNHRIPLLWRFHKVHHVDTHVDVTTALRFHPGELFFSALIKSVWIVIWGPTFWAFIIFESCVSLAAHFHHCNIDFPDKIENPLRAIFVTPRFHTAHHTVCKRTGNANFSTIFIFWDKVFKTYGVPDYTEMEYLGLPSGRDNYLSMAATLKGPFSKMY